MFTKGHKFHLRNRRIKKGNKIDLFDNYALVYPTNSERPFSIDIEDVQRVKQYTCFVSQKSNYSSIRTNQGNKTYYLGRFLLNSSTNMEVDHIDGNTFNNKKDNLRFVTVHQNSQNRKARSDGSSGFKGVSWKANQNKWVVRIQTDGKRIHIGYFTEKEEAARAYDEAAKLYFGEYARLNFPDLD